MIVMKFGGTSLGDADRFRNAAEIIKSKINERPIVVVSAVTKVTDMLLDLVEEAIRGQGIEIFNHIVNMHKEIISKLNIDENLLKEEITELKNLFEDLKRNGKINPMTNDLIASFGERMSVKILASVLNKNGIKAIAFNSYDLGMITDSEFGNAEVMNNSYEKLEKNIKKILRMKITPVITGFLGKNEQGNITTLGRGGSDYSASIIGNAINANEIQIWTDVDGIMSADPKVVSSAKTIEAVSFSEASELAYFGAKVLHPKTIIPAIKKNIPVIVLNSFNPKHKGTRILNSSVKNKNIVKAIAFKKNVTLINVSSTRMLGAYGFLAKLFYVFDKFKKSIDVISTSEVSVSMSMDNAESLDRIVEELRAISNVDILKNRAVICIVGDGIKNAPEIAGKTFLALGKNKINVEMISQGASKINITFVVEGKNAESSVKILHKEFFGKCVK